MQVGFVSLEAGYSRAKNVRNILLKNIVDVLLVTLTWWGVGYAVANGPSQGGFIGGGSDLFFGNDNGPEWVRSWFFSFTFALATVSIVSGCLAERTQIIVYPIVAVVMTIIVHPVIAFWAWNMDSWLQTMSSCRFLDFAGGTVVHGVGGCMGFIGAYLCGARIGRFEEGSTKELPGHDVTQVAMGTMFLWFGWFGFNCGSVYNHPEGNLAEIGRYADRVALNMSLSASGGGLTTLLITSLYMGTFDLCHFCNGVLSGLVAATPVCGFVTPWASLVVGIIAGPFHLGFSRLLKRLQIDDPLDSTAIHMCCGILGTILNGAFAKPEFVVGILGPNASGCGGFVYTSNGGLQLGMQLLGAAVALAWTAAFSFALFIPLKMYGRLRVDQATELAGIDNMDHGGPAYPEFTISVANND